MADYTAKKISDMQAGFGGGFIKARAELGVSSFGMQVIAMPPNFSDYPEHDHGADGQEEVYAVLDGSGTMDVEGEQRRDGPRDARARPRRDHAQGRSGPRGDPDARPRRLSREGVRDPGDDRAGDRQLAHEGLVGRQRKRRRGQQADGGLHVVQVDRLHR